MNEAETRAVHIDPALKTPGWGDLGAPEDIGRVFAGFQRFLYQPQAANVSDIQA
jgi:hypothetical protein